MKGFRFGGSLLLVALLAIGCLALVSCGSGSGSGSVSGSSASTGSVAILLTDKPSGEFSEVWVTVTKIELLSDHGRVTVSDKEQTIDLLTLKNETMLVDIGESVPVGWYSKIRLTVKDVTVKEIGPAGDYEPVKLPANGKIDLNPRVPFYVAPGEMLTVQLDLDAKKSIHLHETGNGKYMFRPVVFITVIDGVAPEKLVRIHGFVGTISGDGFTVCPELVLSESDFCTQVYVTEGEPSFFSANESGGPVEFGDLTVGNEVTVVGLMRMKTETTHYDGGDDGASWLGIDAIVVEIGGFLEKLRGTALLPVDASERFPFELMNGSGIEGTPQVQIQEGTKIYSPGGDPLDASSIEIGTVAEVDGVLLLKEDPDVLNAAFILIDTAVEPETALSGTIVAESIDASNSTFDLYLGESVPVKCVDASKAQVYVAQESGSSYTFVEGEFADLMEGMEVDAYGAEGDGCFVAETIIAYESSGNGT